MNKQNTQEATDINLYYGDECSVLNASDYDDFDKETNNFRETIKVPPHFKNLEVVINRSAPDKGYFFFKKETVLPESYVATQKYLICCEDKYYFGYISINHKGDFFIFNNDFKTEVINNISEITEAYKYVAWTAK